jgi:integrase
MYEMANLHYYLEKRNVKEKTNLSRECPVILSFSYFSFRVKTYIGRKIEEQEWDKTTERVKPIYSKSEEINAYLEMLGNRVEGYFSEMEAAGRIPDPSEFKKEVKKMIKFEVPSFFNLLLRFIEENQRFWRLSTYKKMKTFYSQLKEYSIVRNEPMIPGMVNQILADKLINFYRERGLGDISIKKNLDLLKWFMNWCRKNNLIFNRDYENISISPVKSSNGNKDIYLRWDELIRFYCYDGLPRKEEWCRDIFCFIAFTGIRFSKINSLKKSDIDGRYIQQSENHDQKILLNRFSGEICKKYENRFYRNNTIFPGLSLITFHKHLKKAASGSGLNRSVSVNSNVSALDVLNKQISAKIAINTYYANAVRLDNPEIIKALSKGLSSKSRIIALSGSLKLAEEKQITTTNHLYESIRNSGTRP